MDVEMELDEPEPPAIPPPPPPPPSKEAGVVSVDVALILRITLYALCQLIWGLQQLPSPRSLSFLARASRVDRDISLLLRNIQVPSYNHVALRRSLGMSRAFFHRLLFEIAR